MPNNIYLRIFYPKGAPTIKHHFHALIFLDGNNWTAEMQLKFNLCDASMARLSSSKITILCSLLLSLFFLKTWQWLPRSCINYKCEGSTVWHLIQQQKQTKLKPKLKNHQKQNDVIICVTKSKTTATSSHFFNCVSPSEN
jgi:hypothetical protein